MKTLPTGLRSHLAAGSTTLSWCWRLTRADGTVYGFTDHDHDLAFDGTVFEAASGYSGTDICTSVGLSVDNLNATGALQSARLDEAALASGLFDGAGVEIWRVNWAASGQRILLMSGSIGEVKRGASAFSAELRGLAHYLSQESGRNYQYACDACFGDARCSVDANIPPNTATGTVSTASTRHLFTASGLETFEIGWFEGGMVTWKSGDNPGQAIEVKSHTSGAAGLAQIELWRGAAFTINPDDQFVITAGCDKTFSTCRVKFRNGNNFRGFPHIPGNSYVLTTPSAGDPNNDGGSITR